MLDTLAWFATALLVVFLINLVPAFMPSSWMVMAFFYIQFDLPLLPLAVAGAIISGLGRWCLAKGSDLVSRTLFKKKREDLQALGGFLKDKENLLPIVVFGYALTPLPTNNLFVAAGMIGASMRKVLLGFWAARIPADFFWIWISNATFRNLGDVFEKSSSNWLAVALQIGSLGSVLLLYILPWGKWLRSYLERDQPQLATAR